MGDAQLVPRKVAVGPAARPARRSLRAGPNLSVNWARRILRGVAKLLALGMIRFYQVCISPVLASPCRFQPSCSVYAYEAVTKWGAWTGGRLAAKRLLRCRPWGSFGYDPVPEHEEDC